jgi:hypothetical protein
MKMQKLQNIIAKYNQKAEAWGYETLSFDSSIKELNTVFSRKAAANCNAFKNIKLLYRDGYLESEFNKIQKLISEL